MKQAHSELRHDAAKKRRVYIAKIGITFSVAGLCGAVAIAGVISVVLACIGTGFALSWGGFRAMAVPRAPDEGGLFGGGGGGWTIADLLLTFGPWLGGGILAAVGGFVSCKRVNARTIPYAPTVSEQIAGLATEDVLLRGSSQPTTLPVELLRAAHSGGTEPAEELLRAESRA